jgi:mono/diheme cytochrome c family protein
MFLRKFSKSLTAAAAFAAVVMAGVLIDSKSGQAANDNNGAQDEKQMIQIGLSFAATAGLQLNMTGKDPDMVGLGSYLVNVSGDCNGCHTANPATEYLPAGNPYLLPAIFKGTKLVNTHTYLGGGSSFGFFGPGPNAEIISRNLTPDRTGRPEGGNTLSDFKLIMRTGTDLDHRHPSCSSTITINCLSFPFNGALLQVMPWPNFQNLTDRQLEAIYTFLSTIPCIEGGPGEPANRC